jgi:peptidoglycan biosynthesis protein MviN/MurJ (putative lipid II flippase)
MNPMNVGWVGDWAWGLPLILLTVVIHVFGLALIGERVVDVLSVSEGGRNLTSRFAAVMGATALVATLLHGLEVVIWAVAYRFLSALPDNRSAMLYSLSAMTTFGHANLFLENRWQLMGALEALDGMLLFGLTTAFLFAIMQRVWPLGSRGPHRSP